MRRIRRPLTEIQAPSSATECSRVRKVICRLASAALRDSSAVAEMEIAVGEAFSNAVKYGEHKGKVSVKFETPARRAIAVEMAYPGAKFDTTVRYPQDILTGEGGFGRYIMRQITDSMEYSFDADKTVLRMTKRTSRGGRR
ncbi:MAG: ATP-binding protein [Armatimonadota bacterium]